MLRPAAAAAAWKSSTTITDPGGSRAASFAMEAITSADITPSIASSSAASAPNPGAAARGASMKAVQNRTGSASASSHDNQDVTPPSRVAAQLDSSTLLPAPADPTTTVSRRPAPASSRACSAGLARSVAGSVVGRNFASANRASCGEPRPAAGRRALPFPAVPRMSGAEAAEVTIPACPVSGPCPGSPCPGLRSLRVCSPPRTAGKPAGCRPPPAGLRRSLTHLASSSYRYPVAARVWSSP